VIRLINGIKASKKFNTNQGGDMQQQLAIEEAAHKKKLNIFD